MTTLHRTLSPARLVEKDRVHRRIYIDPEVFALEQQHYFPKVWLFAGHGSQVPSAGDYAEVEIAGRPLLMVRQPDSSIKVLYNRCAHKGAKLATDGAGSFGSVIRCPYHAWAYDLGGHLRTVPLPAGYEGQLTDEWKCRHAISEVAGVHVYREFVFVRLSDEGESFEDYFGEMTRCIDNLVERSPTGRISVAGGVIRNVIHCNWKMYLENMNDGVHVITTHASSAQAAGAVWEDDGDDSKPRPMAMEQILPFAAGYRFFDDMGATILPNGHSILGTRFSLHSKYAGVPEYEAAIRAAHGAERAEEILHRTPQNAIFFPSLAMKGAPQVMRVIRPLAVDRTLIEAWAFRVDGAPELLLERSVKYNALIFSPMSVVAHDDAHLFEHMQRALEAGGNEWISLHRDFDESEIGQASSEVNGANEWLMRNQFRSWARHMANV